LQERSESGATVRLAPGDRASHFSDFLTKLGAQRESVEIEASQTYLKFSDQPACRQSPVVPSLICSNQRVVQAPPSFVNP
jgi:hypothetical protein